MADLEGGDLGEAPKSPSTLNIKSYPAKHKLNGGSKSEDTKATVAKELIIPKTDVPPSPIVATNKIQGEEQTDTNKPEFVSSTPNKTAPPKKFYFIKHVTNKHILEKLKSGQMVVKKILLPANKTVSDEMKQLQTTLPGSPVKIQDLQQDKVNILCKTKPKPVDEAAEQQKDATDNNKKVIILGNEVVPKIVAEEKRQRKKSIYLSNDYLDPENVDEPPEKESAKQEAVVNSEEVSIKRKRGRPKLIKNTEDEENTPAPEPQIQTPTSSPVKRKRGRPRLHPVEEEVKVLKKRGRPRKNWDLLGDVEPKSCWTNKSEQVSSGDSVGFRVAEATSAAQCHRVLELELENMEDDLPLSAVKDQPMQRTRKRKKSPLPIKQMILKNNTKLNEFRPIEPVIETPPTHILIDNCHYPIVSNLIKLKIDNTKPLLLLNNTNSKEKIESILHDLDRFNIYLHDDNFNNEPLTQLLQQPTLKDAIQRKKVTFITNNVLSQYFSSS